MTSRKDALVGASFIVQAAERLSQQLGLRATVGEIAISPGASNVIPGSCELSLDARSESQATLDAFLAALEGELAVMGAERGLETQYQRRYAIAPTSLDGYLQQALRDAAARLELPHMDMISGAGHDAMALATKVPTGMIFVPSRMGVSHAPQEYTSPQECGGGAALLAEIVAELLAG